MAKSPENEHPKKAFGWAARDASGVLSPFNFSRRFVISHLLQSISTSPVLHHLLVSCLLFEQKLCFLNHMIELNVAEKRERKT